MTPPIPATLDLDAAASRLWDVIVIGAGPAGASVAAQLAAAGRSVLLVERKAFPRYKVCGGCLNSHAVALLARRGLDRELRAEGARTLTALHLHSSGRRAVLALPPGLAITRATLDAVLVRAAITAGCAFLPETTAAVGGDVTADVWRDVTLEQSGRTRVSARARVIVVAAGLGHQALRDVASVHDVVAPHARVGVGTVVGPGVVTADDGAVTLAIGAGGYVGVAAVEEGGVQLAAALDPAYLKASGGATAAVRGLLASAHMTLAPDDGGLTWLGTVPLSRRVSAPVAHRVFVVGDAVGYVEPFTGEGMAWALAAADALVPVALAAIQTWDHRVERQWQLFCHTLVTRHQRRCRAVTRVLRYQAVAHLMVAALSRHPGLADVLMPGLTGTTTHEERA